MQKKFDFCILGGGAAGLSLALALARSPLRDKSILIVEKDETKGNDPTWCFWTDAETSYDGILHQTWYRLSFLSDTFQRTWDLHPYRYVMLRSCDFHAYARSMLSRLNVTFMEGKGEINSDNLPATIMVNEEKFLADWIFDSRPPPGDSDPGKKYNLLNQTFLGWEVETELPVFDPDALTLFDMRTPQDDGVSFFYILPLSTSRALLEYAIFSSSKIPLDHYDTALRGYMDGSATGTYRVLKREQGEIPMTDQPYQRRTGQRIMNIGMRGGRVKPSTGYAFARIQDDSVEIVNSLIREGHPYAIKKDSLRFGLYDSIMLELLGHEPELGRPVLSAIFAKNPIQRVFRFLDSRSTPLEDVKVLTSHPPGPFLRAIWRRVFHWEILGARIRQV